jgi:LEA14-like dessication related protein
MMNRIFLVLVSGILFFSCKTPKALVYHDVEHFRLQKAGPQETNLSLDMRLYNPNNFAVKLKKGYIDVYLNDTHLGKAEVRQKTRIARRDTFLLPITLAVDVKNVLPGALQILADRSIMLKLTGKLKVGKYGIYISFPVNYESKQEIRF